MVNYFDQDMVTTPIQDYPKDKIFKDDTKRGWTRPFPDDMPFQGPFTARQGLNIDMASKNPRISSNSCLTIICLKPLLIKLINMQETELQTLLIQKSAVQSYW